MTVSLLVWSILALMVFWTIGAYNRLVRLRARSVDALGSMEKHTRRYVPLVTEHLALSSPSMTDANFDQTPLDLPPLWNRLLEQLAQLDVAQKAAKAGPFQPGALPGLRSQYNRVLDTWNELCCAPGDLAGSQVPDGLHLAWDSITEKVRSSTNGLNQILDMYNEAISQFPASLLAKTIRFQPVETL